MKTSLFTIVAFVTFLVGCATNSSNSTAEPSRLSQPVSPGPQPAPQTPTRPEDAKLLQGLEACAPVLGALVTITVKESYSTLTELLAFIDVQLAATNFSTALARTVEKAASFKTEDISVTISNPRACKLGRIQELLGKEDSKFDDDIKERPDVRGWSRVTWYRYGWAEFAVRDEVVVAVRGNTTGFLRKE